jgi:hypothetical protein
MQHEQRRDHDRWNEERCAQHAGINASAELGLIERMEEIRRPADVEDHTSGIAQTARRLTANVAPTAKSAAPRSILLSSVLALKTGPASPETAPRRTGYRVDARRETSVYFGADVFGTVVVE